MEVYKIRRKVDGLFSMGGSWPRFNKGGKIWKQKGHLTSHLNIVADQRQEKAYEDCELVMYELTETEVDSIPVSVYVQQRKELQLQREQERQAAWDKRQKLVRRRTYEELKQEFE